MGTQIGVAAPSQQHNDSELEVPQRLKYINHSSVASRRDSSFALGPKQKNELVNELSDEISKQMSSKTIIINTGNNDCNNEELEDIDDADIDSMDDADFEYDDDAQTETSINSVHTMQTIPIQQNNVHCSSISKDLNAFQIGLPKLNNFNIQKSAESTTMPRSSLALMNGNMSDNKGRLTKQSILMIHSENKEISMKIDNDIPSMIPENEQHEPLERGMSSMSIGSDMSSISSYNHSNSVNLKNRFSALSSTNSAETPIPAYNQQPNNTAFGQLKKQNVIKLQTTSHAPRSSLAVFNTKANKINVPSLNVTLSPIQSSPVTKKQKIKKRKESTTPIAYSSIDQTTGTLKSLYRFVLHDRNKEIAVGDIVKAPIPKRMSKVSTMKFNGIVNNKDDDDDKDDNVRVVTDNQYTSHYVGIVRYLGTTKI